MAHIQPTFKHDRGTKYNRFQKTSFSETSKFLRKFLEILRETFDDHFMISGDAATTEKLRVKMNISVHEKGSFIGFRYQKGHPRLVFKLLLGPNFQLFDPVVKCEKGRESFPDELLEQLKKDLEKHVDVKLKYE